jgi:methanethiol S-methyltransferase
MAKIAALLYGFIAYLVFLVAFLYVVVFLGNIPVARTIDSGEAGPLLPAFLINTLLLGIFAVQHSLMARPAFKNWWTRFVPRSVERSTYVLFASLALLLLCWQWRPIQQTVWSVPDGMGADIVRVVFWIGWGLVLLSTFLINHFELFGLRQVFARLRGRTLPAPEFKLPFLYKRVRHPIYLGFLLAIWAAPTMTVGHLLFAIGTTGYILIGIAFEERDLIALFGDQYRQYRQRVPMLVPWTAPKADADVMPPTATALEFGRSSDPSG